MFSRTTLGAYVYESRGSGTFVTNILDNSAWPEHLRSENATASEVRSSRAIDYNLDGYQDVLYCGSTGIGVFQNCAELCPRANEYFFEHISISDSTGGDPDNEWLECYGERLRQNSSHLTIIGLRSDAIVAFDVGATVEMTSLSTPNAVWSTFGNVTSSVTPDLVYLNDSVSTNIFMRTGSTTSTVFENLPIEISVDVPDLRQLRLADVDSDSFIDIVASRGTSCIVWFSNEGERDMPARFLSAAKNISDDSCPNVGTNNGNFEMVNLNLDEHVDFVVFGINDDDTSYIQWCLNGGFGDFTDAECGVILPTDDDIVDGGGNGHVLSRVSFADVDSDDDVDIFAIVNDGAIVWWENSGTLCLYPLWIALCGWTFCVYSIWYLTENNRHSHWTS